MTRTLAGRRVAITGAARGIRLATARSMHTRGAHVVIGDLDLHVAKSAARELGHSVVALQVDVADPASFAHFLDEAKDWLGGLDVLVNNAGIMPVGPFAEMPLATAIRAVDINLSGAMTDMHLALPEMLAQGSGHIVNVASVAGRAPVPGGIAYCASKAGLIALTEAARLEYADRGITFTA